MRDTERENERMRERERERETDRERETERQTDRETETETNREREMKFWKYKENQERLKIQTFIFLQINCISIFSANES